MKSATTSPSRLVGWYRLLAVLLLFAVSTARANDWPQFRGPRGAGASGEQCLPVEWSKDKNIRWKAPLPGHGNSTPVIAGGRVFTTASSGHDENRLHVLCLEQASGKQLWHRQFQATGNTLCHPKNNMAAPTPVTDGKAVYALFATGDLAAIDADGDLLWYRSLTCDYGRTGNVNGMSASPVLWRNILILPMDNLADSFLAGVDAKTGKNRWKRARPRDHNWSSPLLVPQGEHAQVVISANAGLSAYDVQSGKELWTWATNTFSNLSTPALAGDLILAPGGPFTALRTGAGSSRPKPVWQTGKLSPNVSSPCCLYNKVYTLNPPNVLVCAGLADGRLRWQQRLPEGIYWSSPVAADDKVYVVNDAGTTTVVQAGDQPKILATNELGEAIVATPAIAGSSIFLRSDHHVYCISGNRQSRSIRALAEYSGPPDKLHVYLLVGQSNMSGRAKVEPEDQKIPKNLFLLDGRGKWVQATHPFVQYTNVPNSVDEQVIKAGGKLGLNFGLSFARKMLEANPDVAIGLVVNSKGGSLVETWKKGVKNSNYDKTMERVRPIQQTGRFRGVLWHQGESDQKMGAAYLDALAPVISQFRQDLKQPKLAFVAGQLAPQMNEKQIIDAFNRALLKLPASVPYTGVARADDFTGNDTHFDGAETRTLGRRYAAEMLKLQGKGRNRE